MVPITLCMGTGIVNSSNRGNEQKENYSNYKQNMVAYET